MTILKETKKGLLFSPTSQKFHLPIHLDPRKGQLGQASNNEKQNHHVLIPAKQCFFFFLNCIRSFRSDKNPLASSFSFHKLICSHNEDSRMNNKKEEETTKPTLPFQRRCSLDCCRRSCLQSCCHRHICFYRFPRLSIIYFRFRIHRQNSCSCFSSFLS